MRKILILLFVFLLFICNISFWLTTDCYDNSQFDRETLKNCQLWYYCFTDVNVLKQRISQKQKEYNDCLKKKSNTEKYNKLIEQWQNKINNWDFFWWISLLEQARNLWINSNILDSRSIESLNNKIWVYYINQWDAYYSKNDKKNAWICYENWIVLLWWSSFYWVSINKWEIYHRLWKIYIEFWDYEKAYEFLLLAKKNSLFWWWEDLAKDLLNAYNWKNALTNDEFSFYQYYLNDLNILKAQDKLHDNKLEVIIAVIDDWVNINHPDLQWHIWTNNKEIPWNWIDDDLNWFIDDYNGRDFVRNSNNIQPSWTHWTAVANIIAANKDNKIWIAWIVPKVKIMPINVFNSYWTCSSSDVMKALKYAKNNWAHIINMSLWWSQFQFSTSYNNTLKEINLAWIPIIVAAWNWDVNTNNNVGVNTSVNKISYACNEDNPKTIITVWALNKKWNIANWSNYWSCVDFYAPWEEIPYYRANSNFDLLVWNWTSFSAPIIAWIIWLWYNKYWRLKPNIIYDALSESITWNTIDASVYLDTISANYWELKKAIQWMYNNWLTKRKTAKEFNYSRSLRRDEAAKFLVEYAKTILKLTPNYKEGCVFYDLDNASSDLKHSLVEACWLWIFKWNKWYVKPDENLTNAQAITVFMRLIRGKKDESWKHYADRYYTDAWNLWLLSGTPLGYKKNYDEYASRWDVALMLYRWSKLKK